jgi:hypothetical protein
LDIEELKSHIDKKQQLWDKFEKDGKHSEMRVKGEHVSKRPVFRNRLNNYSYNEPEFVEWLKQGYNYGVTSAGELIKLESDDVARWRELGVFDKIPQKTFTVQSSKLNRQHFYYFGPLVADCKLCDPDTGEDIGHIRGTGEAGGRGGMVVGPGSRHPSGVWYEVQVDAEIATITQEQLDEIKALLGVKEKAKKKKSEKKANEKSPGDLPPEFHERPFGDVTCFDVLGHGWQWHYDGSEQAGPNPFGNHKNEKKHRLHIYENGFKIFIVSNVNKVAALPG